MNLAIVKEKLIEDGFRVKENPDGSLSFMFEGGNYYIDTDVKDDFYIRVGYPRFWTLSELDDRHLALETANKLTESMKAAKVYLIDDSVYCTVEQFLPDANAVLSVLPRYLGTIQGAARTFSEKMSKRA